MFLSYKTHYFNDNVNCTEPFPSSVFLSHIKNLKKRNKLAYCGSVKKCFEYLMGLVAAINSHLLDFQIASVYLPPLKYFISAYSAPFSKVEKKYFFWMKKWERVELFLSLNCIFNIFLHRKPF
jgi:hypothetical protein